MLREALTIARTNAEYREPERLGALFEFMSAEQIELLSHVACTLLEMQNLDEVNDALKEEISRHDR